MSLKVGIVGLPNVGKSTLFNALASRRLAATAAHPFTTIEPHEAIVALPDERLRKLSELSELRSAEVKPATVMFVDIAGLVKGAHQGEGLGNQFLAKIREADSIVHVVRAFPSTPFGRSGQVIPHVMGDINPVRDIEVVNLELELGEITGKPVIYVMNVDEKELSNVSKVSYNSNVINAPVVVVSAKLEEELSDLESEERKQYLHELGIEKSGLEQLIQEAYRLLGLITFYTIKGGKEVRAWSLKDGSTALAAAGQVHTDFAKTFIKAEVVNVDELLIAGGWQKAKEQGKVRLEGKDYIVKDGDVIEFKIGA